MRTAYYNAQVYTGELPLCQAFLVENGRFQQVGSDQEILSILTAEDQRIDLHG